MGQKDILEKKLCAFNDVFSDIVNNLLFGGRDRVTEDALDNADVHSVYAGENAFRELERDVAKCWKHNDLRLALLGTENETQPERDMPIRVIGYDGASYRDQIRYETDETGHRIKTVDRYPVVTMVLYFGYKQHWDTARTLHEALGDTLREDLKPFVSDYRINVFEIAWLTDEQLEGFKSDFKYVADYFIQMRRTGEYHGSKEKMRHVREVLQLLASLTGDNRFTAIMEEGTEFKEGGVESMSEALDLIENRGIIKGIEKGIEQGEDRHLIDQICRKLRKGKDVERIADELEEDIVRVQRIVNVAEDHAPDYDLETVLEAVKAELPGV